MGGGTRRPGGNWSVQRIDKAEDYQTILYEIDMLRFSHRRVTMPPDGARDADVWAYLESFLVHYGNLLDFFGKPTARNTDLTLLKPQEIWSVGSGVASAGPPQKELNEMLATGRRLWEKYEDSSKRDDTISRYLQHCTTYRTSPKEWYPVEMMSEIGGILEVFERYLPPFKPATNSRPVDRAHFLGGGSMSTHSGTSPSG